MVLLACPLASQLIHLLPLFLQDKHFLVHLMLASWCLLGKCRCNGYDQLYRYYIMSNPIKMKQDIINVNVFMVILWIKGKKFRVHIDINVHF